MTVEGKTFKARIPVAYKKDKVVKIAFIKEATATFLADQ